MLTADEGDPVALRATVARADDQQAFIEFLSMEGPYSIRVPLSELTHHQGDPLMQDKNGPMPALGDRVTLLKMPDDPDPIAPGTQGSVNWIGGEAEQRQIGVQWDNGRTLLLLHGIDVFEIATSARAADSTPAELRRVNGRS